MKIIGISDPIIKYIKNQKKTNKEKELLVVEDLYVLSLTQKYELEVQTFIYCPEVCYKEENQELIHHLEQIAHESYQVSRKTYESIVDKENSAGLLAVIKKQYESQSYLNNQNQFILVVDQMEIPGNLGSIVRTSNAVKVDLVLNVDSITNINSSKVTTSSRGMNLIVPITNITYENAQKYLVDNEFDIYLGEPTLGISYKDYQYQGKIAIVVGSERFGINPKWYEGSHKKVFIPMRGEMSSLNVSIAASILLYEAFSKRSL